MCERGIVRIEVRVRQMDCAQTKEKVEGGIDHSAVADDNDSFVLVLSRDAIERSTAALHKLSPTFRAGYHLIKRLLVMRNVPEVFDVLIHVERIIFGKAPFLYIIVVKNSLA